MDVFREHHVQREDEPLTLGESSALPKLVRDSDIAYFYEFTNPLVSYRGMKGRE